METTKESKIEAAIKDTKLRLEKAQQDIMLAIKARDTLQEQLESLQTIRDSKDYV